MTSDERRERLHRAMSSEEGGLDGRTGERINSASERPSGSRLRNSGRDASEEGYSYNAYRPQRSAGHSRTSRPLTSGRTAKGRGRNGRRRGRSGFRSSQIMIAVLISLLLVAGVIFLIVKLSGGRLPAHEPTEAAVTEEPSSEEDLSAAEPETDAPKSEELLSKARLMAAQYDYDGALLLLDSEPSLKENAAAETLKEEINAVKETLHEQDLTKVTHIFFHILMTDIDNALNSSRWGRQAGGYNSLMTTIPEFERILEAMYDKGYVLISLHDMGHMEKQADGTEKMVRGKIMLPEGKHAFVMSEDDVCYYEYMKGAGFADKIIIGEDGRPTAHYTDKDGNEFVGDYDIVPILDKFIDEHPDFSYHGHKACLVFTGYNGVLGYRTDESYLPENYKEHGVEGGHDVAAERAEAVKVLKALYEDGYDLGSHSWGHRDMGAMSYENLVIDSDKWERNVNSLIKEATGQGADILIYPKGADIGDWRGYTSSDQKKEGCRQKFDYLYKLGFRYFCNVDSSQYWVQFGDSYIRTGRRALDGFNLYYDMENQKGRFTDLWDDTAKIFDSRRPTPVPSY